MTVRNYSVSFSSMRSTGIEAIQIVAYNAEDALVQAKTKLRLEKGLFEIIGIEPIATNRPSRR